MENMLYLSVRVFAVVTCDWLPADTVSLSHGGLAGNARLLCPVSTVCLHSIIDSRHSCLLLLLKTVVNCNVASASVSLHTSSFVVLYKFVFDFNLTLSTISVFFLAVMIG